MKNVPMCLLAVAVVVALSLAASADVMSYSDSVPLATMDWTETITIAQFHPSVSDMVSFTDGIPLGTTNWTNTAVVWRLTLLASTNSERELLVLRRLCPHRVMLVSVVIPGRA